MDGLNVGLWHLAEINRDADNVSFRGQGRHARLMGGGSASDPQRTCRTTVFLIMFRGWRISVG
jgi:hypothetical protein